MRIVSNTVLSVLILFGLLCIADQKALAHCEIPCGIYGDKMRIDLMEEHVQTVEKSMTQIRELSKEPGKNANQLVRWVNNKELHANKIQEIVSQYFMHQRITPVPESDAEAYKKYVHEITTLHRILVEAMKCKQTTSPESIQSLRTLLHKFEESYFENTKRDHPE